MTYGYVLDVPAPIGLYDMLHAAITRRDDGAGYGMLLNVGRETPGGFQVIEIWGSKEQCERFGTEIVEPAVAELTGGQPMPAMPERQEFEPRGLIIPSAEMAV